MNRNRFSDSIGIQLEITDSKEGLLWAVQKKEAGGITIARKPDTAMQPDMPEIAIESGSIGFILSPEAIARKIVRIARAVSRAE